MITKWSNMAKRTKRTKRVNMTKGSNTVDYTSRRGRWGHRERRGGGGKKRTNGRKIIGANRKYHWVVK